MHRQRAQATGRNLLIVAAGRKGSGDSFDWR